MSKTKIICTLGPATDKEQVLEKMVQGGMDVARLNFSHGSYEEHKERMDNIKRLRKKYHKNTGIMMDTKGPEIRVGTLKNEFVLLETGNDFSLFCDDIVGDEKKISVSYKSLYKDVKKGNIILLDDGLIGLRVKEIAGIEIKCEILNSGLLFPKKGVNVPEVHINLPYLSEKDKKDIQFAIENDVDFIAASFVRNANDIKQLREFINMNGGKGIHIISKIENREGVRNIDEIIEASDAVMIARGDLGVELPLEEVPSAQKKIIKKVSRAGKPVITATQMLDSMMHNPRPTRAEITDVANAIYDGTSAIMLSGETAAGKYPLESLQTMTRIAERTEQDINYRARFFSSAKKENLAVTDAISHATVTTAYDLNVKAVVTVTKTGVSARMVSRYRPDCMIIAGSPDERVSRQLNLSWGVTPIKIEEKEDVMELFDYVVDEAREKELLCPNDLVVITSGVPIGKSGTTNLIKVHVVESRHF